VVTIVVKDHAPNCLSNDDGQRIQDLVLPFLKDRQPVEVSFRGIHSTTTSFINSAFVELLDYFDFDSIKALLKITHSNNHINGLIKHRFDSTLALRTAQA
jgi:hypothetical protein